MTTEGIVAAFCLAPILILLLHFFLKGIDHLLSPRNDGEDALSEERKLNGHVVSSHEEIEKWFVLKGKSEGIVRCLSSIERDMETGNFTSRNYIVEQWKRKYQEYRSLCIEYGIWNIYIGDRQAFKPTAFQLELEKKAIEKIEELPAKGIAYKREQDRIHAIEEEYTKRITECVAAQYRKRMYRHELINELAGRDPEERKTVQKHYRRLLSSDVLREKQDETRHFIVYFPRKPKTSTDETATSTTELPASHFDAARYKDIYHKTEYKIYYTVSAPLDLNKSRNSCRFISDQSGEKYATTLEKCTCPMGQNEEPCKHMVALAICLGYYSPKTSEGIAWQKRHKK